MLREREAKPIKMQIAEPEPPIFQMEPNQGNSTT